MPIEIGVWKLNGDEAIPVPSSSLDQERRLEAVLENDISILGLDLLLVIGRQVPTSFGKFIDLLCLDAQGDVFVIELKRDRTPREVVAQALDYGSWVRTLGHSDLADIYASYQTGADLEAAFEKRFGQPLPDEINANHRLIVVASELDSSTERIIDYLSDFDIPINAVFFRYLKDGADEYLARSWLIDPGAVEVKATPKKRRPWNQRDFYISFGNGPQRQWEDARKYGFVGGGGDPWYSRTLNALKEGHRVFVHIPGQGYVGVGEVAGTARPINEFQVQADGDKKVPILEAPLTAQSMDHDLDDPDKCEYVVPIDWLKTRPLEDAYWEQKLFANQNTAARLRDTETIERLEQHFELREGDSPDQP
jgi:hypothetical protein